MKKACIIFLCCCLLFLSTAVAEEKAWFCSECNLEQNENYCMNCGAKRSKTCSACGWKTTVMDANYCGNCGQRLASEKEVSIGLVVSFGCYEQDGNTENGKEPIRWVVMNVQEDKALLFSVDILDAQPYDTQNADAGWENSTIRQWLNSDFMQEAFTESEIQDIYSTQTGNRTTDQVYLLAYDWTNDLHGLGLGSVFIPDNYESTPVYLDTGIENFEYAQATDYVHEQHPKAEEYYWEQSGSAKNNSIVGDGCFYQLNPQNAYGVRPACWVSVDAVR